MQFMDLNGDLHIRECRVFVLYIVQLHKFLPSLPFFMPPSTASKVFIKQNDGAYAEALGDKV